MKLLGNVWLRSCVLVSLLSLVASGCAAREPTPPEPVRPPRVLRPAPEFKPVKGAEMAMSQATVFVEDLPSIGARMEIRIISVRPHDSAALPTDHEAALEVRSGELETIIDGDRQERHAGDMWLVAQGSRVRLNVLGEHAVIQAIYLIREGR